MKEIINHFKSVDPILHAASLEVDWYKLHSKRSYFASLCRIIIGQQLSVKAAYLIYSRFVSLFPNKRPSAKLVLKLSLSDLRGVGLSATKCASLQDLSTKITIGKLSLRGLSGLSDEEVVLELIRVRGIGPWSAEMFLLSVLERDDVFSPGDLGLRTAIKKLYGFSELPTPKEAQDFAVRWSPYRSHACRILWGSLNNEPT